jgi:hypothetical protein
LNTISSSARFERDIKNFSSVAEKDSIEHELFPPSHQTLIIADAVEIIKELANKLLDLPEFHDVQAKLPKGIRGGAFDWRVVMAIIIIRPIAGFSAVNPFLRRISGDSALLAAFGLESPPSPATISRYKNHVFGETAFELISLLILCELHSRDVLDLTDLVADGAPIKAHLNPKKLRKLTTIPYSLVKRIFAIEDFSWVEQLLPQSRGSKYPVKECLKILQAADFLGFYGIEAFCKLLRNDVRLQEALDLKNGVPVRQTLNNFKQRVNKHFRELLPDHFPDQDVYSVLDELAVCLSLNPQLPPGLLIARVQDRHDLFNLFQTRSHVIDPTARFGFTTSKSEVFIGYRWLVIGTFSPGIPICQYLGQPTQGEPYLFFKSLKKLQKILKRLDHCKSRRSGRIYTDGGLKDAKITPYYRLLRLVPCHTTHANLKSLTPRWTKKRVESEHEIARLVDYGGMRHHGTRHIKYVSIQGSIAVVALQLVALCATKQNTPWLACSPARLFS